MWCDGPADCVRAASAQPAGPGQPDPAIPAAAGSKLHRARVSAWRRDWSLNMWHCTNLVIRFYVSHECENCGSSVSVNWTRIQRLWLKATLHARELWSDTHRFVFTGDFCKKQQKCSWACGCRPGHEAQSTFPGQLNVLCFVSCWQDFTKKRVSKSHFSNYVKFQAESEMIKSAFAAVFKQFSPPSHPVQLFKEIFCHDVMKIQLDACFGLLIDAGVIGALRRKICDEGGVRKSGHRHKQRHFLDDKVRNHKKLYRKKIKNE